MIRCGKFPVAPGFFFCNGVRAVNNALRFVFGIPLINVLHLYAATGGTG